MSARVAFALICSCASTSRYPTASIPRIARMRTRMLCFICNVGVTDSPHGQDFDPFMGR